MVNVTYPGVYIEEIPSGVRTIIGVATSITAFVGRAPSGPVDEPGTVFSWGDYERLYGGLAADYPMSYAVSDFFLNGGTQAVIVRLYFLNVDATGQPIDDEDKFSRGYAVSASVTEEGTPNKLNLIAANPGAWGNGLSYTIDYSGLDPEVSKPAVDEIYRSNNVFGEPDKTLFNLVVRHEDTQQTETFNTVTFANVARRIDRVLAQESSLVRIAPGPLPTGLGPAETLGPDPAFPDDDTKKIVVPVEFDHGTDGIQDHTIFTIGEHYSNEDKKTGLYQLAKVDLFNLLCTPPDDQAGDVPVDFLAKALQYCSDRRAMLIVDSRSTWVSASEPIGGSTASKWLDQLGLTAPNAKNAAIYFPRVRQENILNNGQMETFVPCGIIAGIMASTDAKRGVWKAPAGIDDGVLKGTRGLEMKLTDGQNGALNPFGINCLRSFPTGPVVWGARTLRGADIFADEYKYVPVRRTALYIEESLYRGLQWVVFEPNDEPLWAQIRLNVGGFMQTLFRQGAFQGASPRDAYFVKCDSETTTQNDINLGIVNIVVGFAPLKPAEFVVIGIQQMAGQIEV